MILFKTPFDSTQHTYLMSVFVTVGQTQSPFPHDQPALLASHKMVNVD